MLCQTHSRKPANNKRNRNRYTNANYDYAFHDKGTLGRSLAREKARKEKEEEEKNPDRPPKAARNETMPSIFKDESIIIIAPGSQTTLALSGLPETFGPPKMQFRTCMFKDRNDTWSPIRYRLKPGGTDMNNDDDVEEDPASTEGACWPIRNGIIVDMECLLAFLSYVYNSFHQMSISTPVLFVIDPSWGANVRVTLTNFFFATLKVPALWMMDAAIAAQHGFATPTVCVVDIGYQKTDITPIVDHSIQHFQRLRGVTTQCGDVITIRLQQLLNNKGFTRDMCEQLKKSGLVQILPRGTPIPVATDDSVSADQAAAGATGSDALTSALPQKEEGDAGFKPEDNEGVLDVAGLVTGDRMNEYLAQKEKEKAEKGKGKKGGDAAQAKGLKPKSTAVKEKATFIYEEWVRSKPKSPAATEPAIGEASGGAPNGDANVVTNGAPVVVPTEAANGTAAEAAKGASTEAPSTATNGAAGSMELVRREIEVGPERFQAVDEKFLEELAFAIHRAIQRCEARHRTRLWENIAIVGMGSRIKGFKEALHAMLLQKFVISPSSATMFTSEIPSNFTTPTGTGANTPQPQAAAGHGSGSLLQAATVGQASVLSGQMALPSFGSLTLPTAPTVHQVPTRISFAKLPEYLGAMKDDPEHAPFLGAQVAARGIYQTALQQGDRVHMSRQEFNEHGPNFINDVYCYAF